MDETFNKFTAAWTHLHGLKKENKRQTRVAASVNLKNSTIILQQKKHNEIKDEQSTCIIVIYMGCRSSTNSCMLLWPSANTSRAITSNKYSAHLSPFHSVGLLQHKTRIHAFTIFWLYCSVRWYWNEYTSRLGGTSIDITRLIRWVAIKYAYEFRA